METSRQEPLIIELDDPTPRWFQLGVIAAALVVVALIAVPFLIDVEPTAEAEPVQTQSIQSSGYAPVCQPRIDIPSFAEPAASVALPSWMRICDWFAQPGGRPAAPTSQQEVEYRFADD
jgi:hypothetical protein